MRKNRQGVRFMTKDTQKQLEPTPAKPSKATRLKKYCPLMIKRGKNNYGCKNKPDDNFPYPNPCKETEYYGCVFSGVASRKGRRAVE